MCGILGFIGPRSFSVDAFGHALDVMQNRGPDDRGIYEEPECLLGHRRLSILDLSPAGHQPMGSPNGRYTIVFNGEVYNYRELRKPLEDEGLPFRSHSDTEVILALYAREGPDCLQRLRGMFAMALWDRLEKSLFLARDRMGIKPLYFWPRPQGVAFASEVKALKALPGGPSEINPQAVAAYLAWGSVPEPKTIVKGVEALPPGTWALWKGGTFRTEAYWRIPDIAPTIHHRDEAIEMLRPILREAVALRCISDAPLGAFLSGGIDSSSVVALMRDAGQSDLRTFSISFPQTALDESPYALKVAEEFGTLHTDISVTEGMVRSELDGFFRAMDQPTCDGVNTYLVSKFARQGGLTVSLSGLGGDELFAGYPSFQRIRKVTPWLTHMPGIATWAASKAASMFGGRLTKLEALSLPCTQNSELEGLSRSSTQNSALETVSPSQLKTQNSKLTTQNFLPGSVHTTTTMELRAYLLNQLLRDSDVFGMANSLEIRVPLIGHKLVEALFQIDEGIILQGSTKALLLDSLPTPLPRLCTHRSKMGFTFPFDAWMKGPWRDIFEPCNGAGNSALNQRECHNLWSSYSNGRSHWSRPWAAMVLQHATA